MTINTQFELKKDPMYLDYIRGNSYWYKILTRNPEMLNEFKKELKDYQKKQKINKFTSMLQYIEMLQTVVSSLK